MTLDEIMKALYYRKETYFLDIFGKVKHNRTTLYADRNNCRSERHIEHWLRLNDLLNVAAHLNGDWRPDWSDAAAPKYVFCILGGEIAAIAASEPCHFVYFRSEEAAMEAVRILGAETVRSVLEGI